MKKILISLMSLLVFTSCILHSYSFISNYNNNRVFITTNLVDEQKENSPLDYIWIYDKRSKTDNHHSVKILSPTIKIVCKDKEYIIKNSPNDDGNIYVYKQGVVITDDFKAYIGKVQLDDGTIIDVPPLLFKKTVYVEKYSVISDTINTGRKAKKIFNGTVEDYKNQKK